MKFAPPLDQTFQPANLWERAFQSAVARESDVQSLVLACRRPDGTGTTLHTTVPGSAPSGLQEQARQFVERRVKFLLWACGGSEILIDGPASFGSHIKAEYSLGGSRAFDVDLMRRVYGADLVVQQVEPGQTPILNEEAYTRGRNLDGCRIGFDLGGSDRKSAAVIDGEVVFSEEIPWSPYFESDPTYHISGIQDSLTRAASHLPRVDAIGGSAAGIYVNNEVRIASLFRGIPAPAFEEHIRPLFLRLREQWGVPFEVANDGDVTALAGSMALNRGAILGISMGTSLAAGYVTRAGSLTPRLSELAFAPIEYNPEAPVDEWSKDRGCGVQYFSQQAVARLVPRAGISLPPDLPHAEQLRAVQELVAKDDPRAKDIFRTIGIYLGYTIPHWRTFYDFDTLLLLGRVTSGAGGSLLIENARAVLETEFPDLADVIEIVTPDERQKRHGQAIAAASLPSLKSS